MMRSETKHIRSGEEFPVTGYYKYVGHVDNGTSDCFIPKQSNRLLFKANETAPMLGSCPHSIEWKLIKTY